MKKLIFPFFIFYFPFFILHSTAQVTFQKTYSNSGWDISRSVEITTDGGYIIGAKTVAAGNHDIYLIKTDSNGDTIWTKTYGGTGSEWCYDVKQTVDGGYILNGTTSSFGAGGGDIYLIRTGADGDTLWTRTYGGSNDEVGWSMQKTTDNGYIIIGQTPSYGAGFNDAYLIKTDINGDTLWTKTYGGVDPDRGFSCQQTFNGGYIFVGKTSSFGAGSNAVYLIRTNVNGNKLWEKTYGGVNDDYGYSIKQTSDGGFIILGRTTSFAVGAGDLYLIRTDANGDTLWTKTYGEVGSEVPYSFQQTNDGGYIIAGETSSFGADWWDAYMLRVDSMGSLLWSKTYKFGNNIKNTFYDVKQTSDGGFIAVGETGDLFTRDVYVVKTDADGNSGCGDSIVNTITGGTATIVGSPATMVGSGAIVGNTATITGSTATVDSVLCIMVGLQEDASTSFSMTGMQIYPNPLSDYTTIEAFVPEEVRNAEIVIYNMLGILIKRYPLEKGHNAITISAGDLTGGIYFYALMADERMLDKGKMAVVK